MSRIKQKIDSNFFGRHLRRIRLNRNATLEDFAKCLSVSVSYICDIEKGRRSPLKMKAINKLADQFQLTDFLRHMLLDASFEYFTYQWQTK